MLLFVLLNFYFKVSGAQSYLLSLKECACAYLYQLTLPPFFLLTRVSCVAILWGFAVSSL